MKVAPPGPIPWWTPLLAGGELDRLRLVIESNYLNEGDLTRELERRLAERLGVTHAVAVTSGTAALFVALAALGVGPGDEVVVPDITFIATAHAVLLAGARPVLADVDPRTLNLDPGAFEAVITSRTRAVIPVHVSGRAAPMEDILAIAERRGLHVVEDAAEALLSRRRGRALGTFGTLGCFSFSPNKTLTTGQGGLVVTGDAALARRLRELKDQGRSRRGTGGDDVHQAVGFNFKLTNLQAAVGIAQLEALEERLERARRLYGLYARGLEGLAGIRLPGFDIPGGEVPQWVDAVVEDRDRLDKGLGDRGIGCRRFWFPLHTQQALRAPEEGFPVSSRVGPRALWLPSSLTLDDRDVEGVCAAIREVLGP